MRARLACSIAISISACAPAPVEQRAAPTAPTPGAASAAPTAASIPAPSSSAAPSPSAATPPSSAAATGSAAPPIAIGPGWKARCKAAVEEGLRAAAAQDPGLRASYVLDDPGDEIAVASPMGFHLSVNLVRPDLATRDPAGIWQHRAESLHGSYHAMFLRDAGRIQAFLSFDGWPSPRVQPLVPILQAAIDHCFGR